jgi:hypothetical protein
VLVHVLNGKNESLIAFWGYVWARDTEMFNVHSFHIHNNASRCKSFSTIYLWFCFGFIWSVCSRAG